MAINLPASVAIKASVSGQSQVDSLKNSIKGLNDNTGGLARGFSSAASAIKTFVAAYAIGQGVSFLKNIINTADELRDLSAKTNLSVSALSALKTAGELNGLAFESLQTGIKKFSVNIAEAANRNEKAEAGFKALGISIKNANGEIKPTSDLLFQVADRFKNLRDGPEKAAIAVRLFGKAGFDLIPLLNEGSEKIKKFGLAFSDDFANRADQFNDSLIIMQVQIQNLIVRGLDSLLPVLQELLNVFSTLPSSGKESIGFLDVLGEGLRFLVIGGNAVVEIFLQIIDVAKSGTQVAGDFLSTVASQTKAVLTGNFSEASKLREDFVKRTESSDQAYLARSQERLQKAVDFTAKLSKNSLFFGDGTVEEIKRRQKADTAPEKRRPGSAAPADVNALDSQNKAGVKFAQDKIRTINAETRALQENEDQKKKIIVAAELEQHGLKQGTKLYDEYIKKINEAYDAQEKLKTKPELGVKRALEEYIRAANDFAAQTQSVVGSVLKGLEDQFVSFFTTGAFQWKQFANTIIAEIVRIAVKKAIIAPLAAAATSAFGFADGGIMTAEGPVPLRKYASGGIANSSQLALFGEGSKPEAFVPLPDGRNIPVKLDGGNTGGGGNTNVNVTVNMQSGEQNISSPDSKGQNLGKAISLAVQSELVKQRRAGGLLA